VAVGSRTYGNGTSDSSMASGGQVASSGEHGSASGNVLTVPAALDPDVFGDAVSSLGKAQGVADNTSEIDNGGDSTTKGGGPLDAYDFNWPVGADVDVLDAPVPVLGQADTMVEDDSVLNNGDTTEHDSAMALPGGFGGTLGYGTMTPDFPQLPSTTVLSAVPRVPSFTAPGADMPAPGVPVPGAAGPQSAPAPSLPDLPGLPQVPSVPLVQGAVLNAGQLPVQQAASLPTTDVRNLGSLGGTGTGMAGVSGLTGIAGVLPVAQGLFPNV
jgi:trimeric autotransporter adhesin